MCRQKIRIIFCWETDSLSTYCDVWIQKVLVFIIIKISELSSFFRAEHLLNLSDYKISEQTDKHKRLPHFKLLTTVGIYGWRPKFMNDQRAFHCFGEKIVLVLICQQRKFNHFWQLCRTKSLNFLHVKFDDFSICMQIFDIF